MTWKAIARSATGISHQKLEIPCQDYGSCRILENDVITGAVADGAGSAKHADLGAKVAVEAALQYLSNMGEYIKQKKRHTRPFSEQEAAKIFTKMLQTWVIGKLQQMAERQGYEVKDLACTLLVFIATPHWLTAMQIGDGFINVRLQDGNYELLFEPDKGEYLNETTFVISNSAIEKMQVKTLSGKQEFICVSTDGLEKVAVRLSDWTPFAPFFTPLEEYLRETENPETDDSYLKDFLNSERLNARTNDDKTLLLCQFQESTPVSPPRVVLPPMC